MKAIETTYGGYRMRSRLEARWAVFFDRLGVKWVYEPEGYVVPGVGVFLPDFLLTNVCLRNGRRCDDSTQDRSRVFVEVKPTIEHANKCYSVFLQFGLAAPHPLIVCVGECPAAFCVQNGEYLGSEFDIVEFSDCGVDQPMALCRCYRCHAMKFDFYESNYLVCPRCGSRCDDEHPAITTAVDSAKAARFERY